MHRDMYSEKILEKIKDAGSGDILIVSDFLDIASLQAIKKALSRLVENGSLRRVMRGVYEKPKYNNFLYEYVSPSPDKVAQALARNYGWTIVPCGDTALNLLGLSDQTPTVWSYVSDGTYKKYEFDKIVLDFKKTSNKEVSKISYKTALLIQALKAFGKENITADVIATLANQLTKQEKNTMLTEAKYATVWIYETIKLICSIK